MEYLETTGKFEIYRAEDSSTGQRVLLKRLTNFGSDGDDHARFVRELRTCCIIDSQFVVKTIAVEQEAQALSIIMEYPSGESLRDILERQSTLSIQDAVEIAQQCLCGLEAAHRLLIVHRDLKPEDVYVTRIDGTVQVKIADFGVAGFRGAERNMSVSGYFRGTPGYMPPEQVFLWPDTGVSSDVFSLGAMLFEMLTGLLPYGDDWRIAPANALEENMASHPAAPDGLWTIVKCAIHPLPSQRYRSARAMRVAIDEFTGKSHLTTPPARRRPVALGAAIGVLVGFALAWSSVKTVNFANKTSTATANVTHLQMAAANVQQRSAITPVLAPTNPVLTLAHSATPNTNDQQGVPHPDPVVPTSAPQAQSLIKSPSRPAPSKVVQLVARVEKVAPPTMVPSGYSKPANSQKTAVARPASPTITVEVSAQLADVDDLKILLDGTVQHRATWGIALPTELGHHQLVASAPGRKAWATTVSLSAAKPHQTISIPVLKEQDSPEGAAPLHEANLATADVP
jgi:serine/threonine protein kinase